MSNPWDNDPIQQPSQQAAQMPWDADPIQGSRQSVGAGQQTIMRQAPEQPQRNFRPIAGALETAGALATSGALEIPAGLYGLPDLVRFFVSGDEDKLAESVNKMEQVQSLAYTPRTETGQQFTQNVAEFFQPLEDFAQSRGEAAMRDVSRFDPSGENIMVRRVAQAGDYAGTMMLPALLGIRGVSRRGGLRSEGLGDIRRMEESTGIDTGARPARQGEQVVGAAESLSGGRTVRAQDFEQIQRSVMQAREATRQEVGRLYDVARNTNAAIPASEFGRLPDMIRTSLQDFDVDAYPTVQRRLNEVESFISSLPENASVRLNSIAQFRQRLNRNRPPRNDVAQNTALDIMKGEIDAFVDNAFNADMISGDPSAVARWRGANQAYRDYKERFSANKAIKQLAEQEATPEQIKNFIIGTSSLGAKKDAGEVVRRLKSIVGEDSPEFSALRQDVIFDIVEPLLAEEPSVTQFIRRHDRFMRQHPTLAAEIFPDSQQALTDLRQLAQGISRARGQDFDIDLANAIGRFAFGHSLSQKAMQVGLATQIIRNMWNAATEPTRQRQIMAEALGYDPMKPIVNVQTLSMPGTPMAAAQAQEELERLYPERGSR